MIKVAQRIYNLQCKYGTRYSRFVSLSKDQAELARTDIRRMLKKDLNWLYKLPLVEGDPVHDLLICFRSECNCSQCGCIRDYGFTKKEVRSTIYKLTKDPVQRAILKDILCFNYIQLV